MIVRRGTASRTPATTLHSRAHSLETSFGPDTPSHSPRHARIGAQLERKETECRLLAQELQNSVFREHVLEEKLEEVLESYHEAVGPRPSWGPDPILIEESRLQDRISALEEELRFYKDSLVKKSSVFDQMGRVLQQTQADNARLIERNALLSDLVSEQQSTIAQLRKSQR